MPAVVRAAGPPRAVPLAVQQIQRVFTVEARRAASRNRLVRSFRPACGNATAGQRLRQFAAGVHNGRKRLPANAAIRDVRQHPGVLPALLHWRDALGDHGWQRAAQIAGAATGASPRRRVAAAALVTWLLATQRYGPPAAL